MRNNVRNELMQDQTAKGEKGAEKQYLLESENTDIADETINGIKMTTLSRNDPNTANTLNIGKEVKVEKEKPLNCCECTSLLYAFGLDLFTNKYFTLLTMSTRDKIVTNNLT